MSIPTNIFDNIERLSQIGEFSPLFEKRMINDVDGKIQYLAITPYPNGATDEKIWNVWKMGYDGNGFINRFQLPDDGSGYKYTFDDIATYFS
jgi:hypothetical protein